jgi:hypothetical protein
MSQSSAYVEKNSKISIFLIVCNVVLALIVLSSAPLGEDQWILGLLLVGGLFTLLLGMYVGCYRGPSHRVAKVLFWLVLLIMVVLSFGVWYLFQLGAAFKN